MSINLPDRVDFLKLNPIIIFKDDHLADIAMVKFKGIGIARLVAVLLRAIIQIKAYKPD
jgi:hypothetical protein